MRTIKIFIIAAMFTGLAMGLASFVNHKKKIENKAADKGFAVVELFTSEGCSSCPPADALVARVEKETGDKPVYILAYHVDYWDRLGWKDAFSNAAYSKRQSEYAKWLKLESVYTPQIVVNGTTEFVGSEEGKLRNAIKAGLQKETGAQLILNASKAGNTASVQYKVEGAANSHTVLSLALIQKQGTTKVERGENGGRTLAHAQIVRNLQTLPLSKNSGIANITLPAGFTEKGYEVIGFVQNTENGVITAASRSVFNALVSASKL